MSFVLNTTHLRTTHTQKHHKQGHPFPPLSHGQGRGSDGFTYMASMLQMHMDVLQMHIDVLQMHMDVHTLGIQRHIGACMRIEANEHAASFRHLSRPNCSALFSK
jgi:hypothetical protein